MWQHFTRSGKKFEFTKFEFSKFKITKFVTAKFRIGKVWKDKGWNDKVQNDKIRISRVRNDKVWNDIVWNDNVQNDKFRTDKVRIYTFQTNKVHVQIDKLWTYIVLTIWNGKVEINVLISLRSKNSLTLLFRTLSTSRSFAKSQYRKLKLLPP